MRPNPLFAPIVVCALVLPAASARAAWHTHTLNVGGLRKGLEDRAGNVWFAGAGGVVRYDGRTWRVYRAADGLGNTSTWALVEDHAGRIWAGTERGGDPTRGGLNWFDGDAWHNLAASADPQLLDVSALAVDDAGRVWVSSDQVGIAVYDGVTWRRFGAAEGVTPNTYSDLLADHAGNVWAAGSSGISRWDGQAWTTYGMAQGLGSDVVNDLFLDRDGRVWAAGGGVSRFDDPAWTTYTTANGMVATASAKLVQDANGHLWTLSLPFPLPGAQRGASRFDGVSTWTPFTTADGVASEFVDGFVADSTGAVWAGSFAEGFSRYQSGRWRTFVENLPSAEVTPLFADRSGRVWARSGDQIVHFDGLTARPFTAANGLTADRVGSLLADHAGRVWASSGSGLFRWDGRAWTRFTTAEGLGSDLVGPLLEDRAGNLWAAVASVGFSRYDGTSWRTFGAGDGLGFQSVGPLALDRAGNVWAASDSGASRFDGSTWRTFDHSDGLPSNIVFNLAIDSLGGVWAGTPSGGVSRYDGTQWSTFTVVDSLDLTQGFLTAMQADRVGGLWLASAGVVAHYDGSAWHRFRLGEGPPVAAGFRMLVDSGNRLWVTLANAGVSRYDGSSWRTYSSADGLGSLNVLSLLEERSGAIWAGTAGGGASRFDGAAWHAFTTADGLGDDTVSPMVEDTLGTLWFGHRDRGLTELEPDRVPPQTILISAPPALGTSFQVSARFDATLEDVGVAQFSTEWSGAPAASPYSADNGWSATLPGDGDFVFRVRAKDLWGNVDASPAEASFALDATAPAASIAEPGPGAPLRAHALVRGTAEDPRFADFRVEIRPVAPPGSSWQILRDSRSPVDDDTLCTFDTRPFADGDYVLRLSVRDTLGLNGSTSVVAEVDNVAPFAEQTSPVRLSARVGGEVWTPDGTLRLYLPPDALLEDAVVRLDLRVDTLAPETLGSGATRVGPVFDLDVGTAALLKLGRVEVQSASGILYRQPTGASWERVGGTRESPGTVLAAPVESSGRFALYDETGATSTPGAREDLRLSPRVFSPGSAGGASGIAIQFSLPTGATTTIRIYNRAGRLVRHVLDRQLLGPGAQSVLWPGTDDDGVPVTDGLYLVDVQAGDWRRTIPVSVVSR